MTPMIGDAVPLTDAQIAAPEPTPPTIPPAVKEIGGREGPDPTRYGDWEKNGRCIDF